MGKKDQSGGVIDEYVKMAARYPLLTAVEERVYGQGIQNFLEKSPELLAAESIVRVVERATARDIDLIERSVPIEVRGIINELYLGESSTDSDLEIRLERAKRASGWLLDTFNPTRPAYFADLPIFLSAKEEPALEYWKDLEDENEQYHAAVQRMTASNLRLVVSIAKKYWSNGIEFEDMIEEGNVGLHNAVLKFDPERGCKFSTLGTLWIKKFIRRALIQQSGLIQIPWQMYKKVEHPTFTSIDYLAKEKDVPYVVAGIDPNEGVSERTEAIKALRRALPKLDERTKNVVKARFGIEETEQTLKEIGEGLGLTKERVRQIEKKGLKKLRELLETSGVHEF